MCGFQRGGGGGGGNRGSGHLLNNLKNIGFLSNFGQDPLKNCEATTPVFNVGPSSAHRETPLKWRFSDDGLLTVVFGSSHPSSTTKNNIVKVGPPTKFSGSVHDFPVFLLNLDICTCKDDRHNVCLTVYFYACSKKSVDQDWLASSEASQF